MSDKREPFLECPHCGERHPIYNPCRNRCGLPDRAKCGMCGNSPCTCGSGPLEGVVIGRGRLAWMEARMEKLEAVAEAADELVVHPIAGDEEWFALRDCLRNALIDLGQSERKA